MLENIIDEIKSNLTGDKTEDVKYLVGELAAHINEPLGIVIAFECSKIILDLLDEEEKEKYREGVVEDIINNSPVILKQISFAIANQDFDAAYELSKYLTRLIENFDIEAIYPSSTFRVYENPLELVLEIYESENSDIKSPPLPLADIFYMNGALALEHKEFDQAIKYLKKAVAYGPNTVNNYIELSEAYKSSGDMDEALETILQALRLAKTNEEIAHCYRSIGYVFVEKELYEEAYTIYRLSLDFERDLDKVLPEVKYIMDQSDKELVLMDFETMSEMLKKFDIPLGANQDIISLCYTLAKNKMDEGDFDAANYFASVGYNLTDLDSFKEILDNIPIIDNELD